MIIGIQCIDTTKLFEELSSSTGSVEYFKLRDLENLDETSHHFVSIASK